MKREKWIALFMLLIALTICFNLYYLYNQNKKEVRNYISMNHIIQKCDYKSIIKSSKCVHKQIKKIYKYNVSNVDTELSYEELVFQGGVCSNWAELYCEIGDELGFNTVQPRMDLGETVIKIHGKIDNYTIGHTFCIWSDLNAYVILDQSKLYKARFGKSWEL